MSGILTSNIAWHVYGAVALLAGEFFILKNNRKFLNWSLASLAAKAAASLANKAK